MSNWEAAWEIHKDAATEAAHVRWMETKQSHGFADHPFAVTGDQDCCAIPDSRHHTDMIPFADLSDEIKAYDYETAIIGFKFGYEAGHPSGYEEGFRAGVRSLSGIVEP